MNQLNLKEKENDISIDLGKALLDRLDKLNVTMERIAIFMEAKK